LEKHTVSNFRAEDETVDLMFLRNVGIYLPVYTVSKPKKTTSK
jgi:hypothetical protein